MNRLRILFVLFLLVLAAGPASADPGGSECNTKSWEDKETHSHNGVTAQIKLQMYRNQGCVEYATSFQVDMEDYWSKKKTSVICDTRTNIFMGNQYTCKWNAQVEKFNWLEFGTRAQTCQILIDWVKQKP